KVTVSWTAPASDGGSARTGYTATASPGGKTCTSTTTRCTIEGLLNTQAYTVTVTAANAVGAGGASTATAAVRPYAKLKMKKPRGSGGRLSSRVRVTGAATITQTATTTAGKRACRKTVRPRKKGSVAVACTLGRATRKALEKRAQTLTVTTTLLTKKGASFQATHIVRVAKTR
ncbi:MAG: fibronectin type III domain-containing protein, partial [Ilumatobacteraceae bacterium]